MVRICFVCLGNICRSPTAEGIMIELVKKAKLETEIQIDSSGTSAYHVGEGADQRSQATANQRGIYLPSRARKFIPEDFIKFDYVVAMDLSNYNHLLNLRTKDGQKVYLLRQFDSTSPEKASVPDPYYGGPEGFNRVFDICQRGCEGLLQEIKQRHNL